MCHCSQQSWLPRDAACRFQVTKDSSSLGQHQQQPQAEIEKILDYTIPLSIEMKRSVCTTLIVLCLIRNNYTNCITTMQWSLLLTWMKKSTMQPIFFQTVQTIPPPHPFLFSLSSPFSSLFPSPFGVGVAWDGVSLIEMGLGDWPTFELDHLHIEASA